MTQLPHPPAAPPTIPSTPASSTNPTCIKCGYDLKGLPQAGACPECATPVDHSLRGMLLQFSSPAYVAKLHRGVFLIVAAIIVQLLLGFTSFAVGMLGGLGGGPPAGSILLLQIASMGMSVVLLVGWWLFSEPDPRFSERDDGSTARKVVRVSVAVYAGSSLFSFVAIFVLPHTAAGSAVISVAGIAGIVGFLAWAVQFFASMLYLRWLAPRIPSEQVARRAKLLIWLGPVLSTVGILLIGLGPLIALILYWNLLDQVRKDLKAIRQRQATPLN